MNRSTPHVIKNIIVIDNKMAEPLLLPYRYLGSSGLKVSTICLGTMTFGQGESKRPGQCDEATAHSLLDTFVQAGGNFIDTADVYQFGLSEAIIGNWLLKNTELRPRMIIATKLWGPLDKDDPNGRGLSRHHICHAVDQSLRRLRTDYIDLYQTHCWDDGTPIEETLLALNDLVRAGKIHYVGVSNVTGWQFQKIIETGKQMGFTQIVSNQAQYNLLCRSTEWELLEVCKREGVAMLPWSPLKGGLLTGKFKRGDSLGDPNSSRIAWVEAEQSRTNQSHPSLSNYADKEEFWRLLETMDKIAAAHEATVSQVAIAWLLHRPTVASVVIGARTTKQLEENMKAVNVHLTPEDMEQLDECSKEPLPYPYEMVFRLQKGRERDL